MGHQNLSKTYGSHWHLTTNQTENGAIRCRKDSEWCCGIRGGAILISPSSLRFASRASRAASRQSSRSTRGNKAGAHTEWHRVTQE